MASITLGYAGEFELKNTLTNGRSGLHEPMIPKAQGSPSRIADTEVTGTVVYELLCE